jgi:uncharacterized protein
MITAPIVTNKDFSTLEGQNYISLTTFRKTGVPVATPVWFAIDGNLLYILTEPEAGKVKRIRNNPSVEVCPCDIRGNLKGDRAMGKARILSESENSKANRALTKKYGWQKRGLDFWNRLQGKHWLYIEITPA